MRWRVRKSPRFGPYFRNYAASADGRGVRGRFTSHGLRLPLGPLGRLTFNFTIRRWTWDHPGPGSVSGVLRRRGAANKER